MADIKKFLPILERHEGGFVNHPNDKGGATKYGITLKTWINKGYDKNGDGVIDAKDIELLDYADFELIASDYWNACKANKIENQSLANFVVDWFYNSGYAGIKAMQRALNVTADGIIGQKTLDAINYPCNSINFYNLKKARLDFVHNIVTRNPSQKVFLNGWTRRINSFDYS